MSRSCAVKSIPQINSSGGLHGEGMYMSVLGLISPPYGEVPCVCGLALVGRADNGLDAVGGRCQYRAAPTACEMCFFGVLSGTVRLSGWVVGWRGHMNVQTNVILSPSGGPLSGLDLRADTSARMGGAG
ncbi:hypothetical protein Tco_0025199 [Tanacetum coccineum]